MVFANGKVLKQLSPFLELLSHSEIQDLVLLPAPDAYYIPISWLRLLRGEAFNNLGLRYLLTQHFSDETCRSS